MVDVALRTRVLLSVQRALVGEIVASMRAIAVEIAPPHVTVRVYHDGAVSEDVAGDFDAGAMTQIVADLPESEVSMRFERVDRPQPVAVVGVLVFAMAGEHFGR